MLNYNEIEIVNAMQDKENLEYLNVVPRAIEKAVVMAKEEIKSLEKIINDSFEKEDFKKLCKKLNGEDELFDAEYPEYNRFSLAYGSLYLTVEQPLDETNNKLKPQIYKDEISIYPDNISDMMGADSLFTLNFNEKIDFEKISNCLKLQGCKEVQSLLKNFFETFDSLINQNLDRMKYKESIYNSPEWLDKDISRGDYSDLLGCMLDMEDECNELMNFSINRLNEIKQFKSTYMELQDQEDYGEENEEERE